MMGRYPQRQNQILWGFSKRVGMLACFQGVLLIPII